ncbi:MAG: uroporphyrinogen decarboxylase family protein [Verrucomicrobiota bacterium]
MSENGKVGDGINSMVPEEKMTESARKLRETYAVTPGAPFYRKEFGYYCLDEWYEQGLDRDADLAEVFNYDEPGSLRIAGLGGSSPDFRPEFEEKILEDRGEHELVRDKAGRSVLYFKGRRSGFMPEYLDHPVKDMKSWEENCKWRMDPDNPERWEFTGYHMNNAKAAAAKGTMISQLSVGGFMYLRSLMGPEDLLYKFYDEPELIRDCMEQWFKLADAVTARHQQYVTFDEFFIDEDVCYNHGPLVSPDMLKEFIFPYYQQLVANIKSRQIDKSRHLYVQLGSDGNIPTVIDHYREAMGVDVVSPCEVASGCDVVEIGKKYPDMVISGGIDKRELAKGKEAIDRMLERILPVMRERGGYIPTCDHGVPAEVSLENYMHYRKRCLEIGG